MARKSRNYTNPFLKAKVPLVAPVATSLPNLQDALHSISRANSAKQRIYIDKF
jgi:hypothetical protein